MLRTWAVFATEKKRFLAAWAEPEFLEREESVAHRPGRIRNPETGKLKRDFRNKANRDYKDAQAFTALWAAIDDAMEQERRRDKPRQRSGFKRPLDRRKAWIAEAVDAGKRMGGRGIGAQRARVRGGPRLAERVLASWGEGAETAAALAKRGGEKRDSVYALLAHTFFTEGIAIAGPEKPNQRFLREWRLSPYGEALKRALARGASGLRFRGETGGRRKEKARFRAGLKGEEIRGEE